MRTATEPHRSAHALWGLFRRLPLLLQVVAWLLLWPLLGALLLARSSQRSRGRALAIATLLLLVLPAWGLTLIAFGSAPDPDRVIAAGQTPAPDAPDTNAALKGTASVPTREPTSAPTLAPAPAPSTPTPPPAIPTETWTVTDVVDGDTIDVTSRDRARERVRIIGIDTPERGECGFAEASDALQAMVLDRQVELSAGAVDDRDRYGRLLRYVDVDGRDAGLALIEAGLAVARYDSRDGYGPHPREAAYVAADEATSHTCDSPAAASPPEPQPPPVSAGPGSGPDGSWNNCSEARAAGAAPVHRGDPGYGRHLDRDNDGVGCE